MTKDNRTYIRVHDGMPDHPKIVPLTPGAKWALISLWCWCSRYLTDGVIPVVVAEREGAKPIAELLKAGLIEHDGDSYRCHDYLVHQRSRDEVAELRAKRAESGRLGGEARARGLALAKQEAGTEVASATASGEANGKQADSKNVPYTETYTDTKEEPKNVRSTASTASVLNKIESEQFNEFWAAYPKRVAKLDAQRRFKVAVKQVGPEVLILGAKRYAASVRNTEARYIAAAGPWLLQGRWDDERPATGPGTSAGPSYTPWGGA